MLTKLRGTRGQGMAEYIIVVALVAVACIGVVSLFGDNVRALFATASNSLAGNESTKAMTNEAKKKIYQHRNMKNFAEGNKPE